MEKELQKIGHRIKLLRIENKISQKVLAKKLCISQTHLSNIENGRVGVTLLHLIKIKELFECPIEYFFEEKTLSENEAEKNECQKIKTIVEENNVRLEDLSKAIEIMKVFWLIPLLKYLFSNQNSILISSPSHMYLKSKDIINRYKKLATTTLSLSILL